MNRETRRKLGVSKSELPPENPTPPRSMDEIQKVYAELCARAGALQYEISIKSRDLEQYNIALENVNNEGAARKKLDDEAKASEKKEA